MAELKSRRQKQNKQTLAAFCISSGLDVSYSVLAVLFHSKTSYLLKALTERYLADSKVCTTIKLDLFCC